MDLEKQVEGKSKYLKAVHLGENDHILTIAAVSMEPMQDEERPVCWFKETEKGFVLNDTNCKRLRKNFGTWETDDWVGQQITIFPTTTDFKGKEVPCIRIRPQDRNAPAAPAAPASESADIPF